MGTAVQIHNKWRITCKSRHPTLPAGYSRDAVSSPGPWGSGGASVPGGPRVTGLSWGSLHAGGPSGTRVASEALPTREALGRHGGVRRHGWGEGWREGGSDDGWREGGIEGWMDGGREGGMDD